MYLQKTLKKRKTTKFPLENGTRASDQDMCKEDNVDEIEPAGCSTLRKKRRTKMRKLVEEMDPACFIQDKNSRNSPEEDKLGVG